MKRFLRLIGLVCALAVFSATFFGCGGGKEEGPAQKSDQQTLVVTPVGEKSVGDEPFRLAVTGGSGSGTVTFALTEGEAVTVSSDGLVTVVKAGEASVSATKAGDDNFNAAVSAPVTITVSLPKKEIEFSDQIIEGDDFDLMRGQGDPDLFDNRLFYRNDLKIDAPDPGILHVTEGEWANWFYIYYTGGGATRGFNAIRSKDLINWEHVRNVFVADRDRSWATGTFWAPEVIYYQSPEEKAAGRPGKYYMFFSALHGRNNTEYERANYSIGMAYADSPAGPFVQFEGTNSDGRVMGLGDVYLETIKFPAHLEAHGKPLIDAHCFVDDDGEIYLYYSLDSQHGDPIECSIWGMRMKDMFTPDYDTVKQLTRFNRKVVGGEELIGEKDFNNEGPFIIKHNGKYFLTFSHAFYQSPEYTVSQAIADSPLGDFVKVDHDKGGQLLTTEAAKEGEDFYDFMAGTGHHSFLEIGDELFIVYHAFRNRTTITNGRHLAMDRVSFIHNGEQEIMYCNGPSYSLQPRPAAVSGYENLAKSATVTATNLSGGLDALTDGLYKNHNFDYIPEATFSAGTRITLTFDKPVEVSAVMVYNAFDYRQSFTQIDDIRLKTSAGPFAGGGPGYALMRNIGFNAAFYRYEHPRYDDIVNMRPGGSSVAVFDPLPVTEIVIRIAKSSFFKPDYGSLAISDIVVLGKEA